jgi:hypothetical protein
MARFTPWQLLAQDKISSKAGGEGQAGLDASTRIEPRFLCCPVHSLVDIVTIARQRFDKHVPAATNGRSKRRTVGGSDLSSVRSEL